ncbi:MAG: RagB/SusD family nutrient uptake outer membrane protein, partial [Candidatus Nephrothrix sp. EaCA]
AQSTYAKALHKADGSIVSSGRTFNPAVHNVWPVPSNEITNGGGVITQNEGW